MTVVVALGDSITLGIGDPVPGGWRGWAALLTDSIPGARLYNLAESGAQSAEVEREQLPRALELRPDLAAVIVGVNDTLRGGFDPQRLAAAISHTIGALRAAGAEVLTLSLPDPGRLLRLPGALGRPLARRTALVNQVVVEVGTRLRTIHFDAASHPDSLDRRMWSVDRLHPSERGHRFVAASYFDLLAARGYRLGVRPDREPTNPPPTRRAQAGWLATQGTRWIIRRSTDLLPHLLLMAGRELLGRPTERATAQHMTPDRVAPAQAESPGDAPIGSGRRSGEVAN